jgi:hypothetical protein
MTGREQAEIGLLLIKDAILEYLAAHPAGVPSATIREELGLDSADSKRQHKGYLFWGLQHLLENEGRVRYEKRDDHNLMFLATKVATPNQSEIIE